MLAGFVDLGRGLAALARRPRLWPWVAAPAAIALAILGGVIWLGLAAIDTPVDGLVAPLPDAVEGWVAGIVDAILVVAIIAAGYFVFFSLAAVVAAPFNEILSESLEAELTGVPSPRFSPLIFLRDLGVGIVHAARRAAVYLLAIAALFLVGLLVPVIGALIAAAGTAYLTARTASWEAMDAVFARKGASYADKRAVLRRSRTRWLGLGAAMALLLLVPGLNLIALSGGAAGATLLARDRGEL